MNIILKQSDIEKALNMYLGTQVNLRGKDVAITFTNGRKDNGISAELEITDRPVSQEDHEGNFGDFLDMIGVLIGRVVDRTPDTAAVEDEAKDTPEETNAATAVVEETEVVGTHEAEAPVEGEAAEAPAKAPVASLFGG